MSTSAERKAAAQALRKVWHGTGRKPISWGIPVLPAKSQKIAVVTALLVGAWMPTALRVGDR